MLSSQDKFSADKQTDGQTDTCKTICLRSIDAGHKKHELLGICSKRNISLC